VRLNDFKLWSVGIQYRSGRRNHRGIYIPMVSISRL
jgi:hypothetical protein